MKRKKIASKNHITHTQYTMLRNKQSFSSSPQNEQAQTLKLGYTGLAIDQNSANYTKLFTLIL